MSNASTVIFISAAEHPWGAEHSLKHILMAIQRQGIECAMVCKEGPAFEFLADVMGSRSITLPRGKSKVRDLWSFFRAVQRSVPARSRVVVFSLDLLPIAILCRLTRHGRSLQLIADIHDNPTKWITRRAVSFFLRFYSAAVVISEYVAPLAKGAKLVHVVPRPIQPVDGFPAGGPKQSYDVVRVGVVGRVDPAKRLELAVDAVKGMSGAPELHVFGAPMADSDYLLEIKAVALEKLGTRAIFRGHQKPEDIYSSIDILFVGNENEPSGRTVGEALSWGVPVVVPDTGGAKEFIVSGESGLEYDHGDASSATHALEDLALDSRKRLLIGQAGRAKMAKERSPENVASLYLHALGVRVQTSP